MNTRQNAMGSNRVYHVFRSSMGITFLSFIATIFGFLTQVILAAKFGTNESMDAYLVSLTIPMMTTSIFVGSLRYTFLPVFVGYKTVDRQILAYRSASNLVNLSSVVFGVLIFLGIIFSREITGLIAPGLTPETKSLASLLLSIQMPSILFICLSSLLSSIFFAEKRFLLPSFASLLLSIFPFIFTYLFSTPMGITAPAWGSLVGSIASLVLLVLGMWGKFPFKLFFRLDDEGTKKTLRLMGPLLFGATFYRADTLIQRYIASSLEPGSISILGYASKIIATGSSLIISGISITLLSHISELVSKEDKAGVSQTFSSAFNWITFLLMPIIVCMFVSGEDAIRVFLQRGEFTADSSHGTWITMVLFSGVLYGGVVGSLVTPVFYAFKDTLTVVKVGISGALLQIAFSLPLAKYYSYQGLSVAYSLSKIVTILAFLFILNGKYVIIPIKTMLRKFILLSGVGLLIGVCLVRIQTMLFSSFHPFFRFTLTTFLICILYLAFCELLGVQEARSLVKRLKEHLIGVATAKSTN